MSTADALAARITHQIAAAIHDQLAKRHMTIAELAAKSGESEPFIKRLLVAEDGIPSVLNVRVLSELAAALSADVKVTFSHARNVRRSPTVKPEAS